MNDQKQRLDLLMVERGLSASREVARAMILAGDVRVYDQVVSRPAATYPKNIEIFIAAAPPYVSRGGLKLARALDAFHLDVAGCTCLDVGASTGGFSDVLLQRGARRIYAVDVGHGQLAWKLRQDPRVVVLEKTNIRYLKTLPEIPDLSVVDVSFISLTLALPPIVQLIAPVGWVIALVKPQFEAGREQVGKGGVVRDPAIHLDVLRRVAAAAHGLGLNTRGCVSSPIVGPAGNREFLLYLDRVSPRVDIDVTLFDQAVACAG